MKQRAKVVALVTSWQAVAWFTAKQLVLLVVTVRLAVYWYSRIVRCAFMGLSVIGFFGCAACILGHT